MVGDGVTVPVHIRFNDLDTRPSALGPPTRRSPPRGATSTDPQFLDRAIDRWRLQTR